MAEPKQKQHKAESKTRRAASRYAAPNLVKCKQCSELIPSHRVCPECGHYQGKEIIKAK